MTPNEALKQALNEMSKLTPQELRAELDKHQDGELATALREAGEFLYNHDTDQLIEKEDQ
jgi:hypothetical protein